MSSKLCKIGIKNGKIYFNNRAFQLKYPTSDSILIFKTMYQGTGNNTFFMRKFKIFNDYFKLRQVSIDNTVRKIINSHTKGHVVKKLTRRSAKSLHEGANPSMAS